MQEMAWNSMGRSQSRFRGQGKGYGKGGYRSSSRGGFRDDFGGGFRRGGYERSRSYDRGYERGNFGGGYRDNSYKRSRRLFERSKVSRSTLLILITYRVLNICLTMFTFSSLSEAFHCIACQCGRRLRLR